MRTDELDDRMRAFEAAMDPCVLPGVWVVARLDGRGEQRGDAGDGDDVGGASARDIASQH